MKKLLIILSVLFLSVSTFISVSYAKDIQIKNSKGEVIGKLVLASGTTYNVYDAKGIKKGTYKAKAKLTKANMKDKKFRLIKLTTGYVLKD